MNSDESRAFYLINEVESETMTLESIFNLEYDLLFTPYLQELLFFNVWHKLALNLFLRPSGLTNCRIAYYTKS